MGPVVGVIGAAQADLALALLDADGRDEQAAGQLVTFDGRTDELRRRSVAARPDCPLCGADTTHPARIRCIDAHAYAAPACAG